MCLTASFEEIIAHHWSHIYCFPGTNSYERFPWLLSYCIVL